MLTRCDPAHLGALIAKLRECGVEIKSRETARCGARREKLVAADVETTRVPRVRRPTCKPSSWRS